jgi:hypothetical protein
LAVKTYYYDPSGKLSVGYIIDGLTYTDSAGINRVPVGSRVFTNDGMYELTESGGVKVSAGPATLSGAAAGDSYIAAMRDAKYKAARAALDAAYRQNVSALQEKQGGLKEAYAGLKDAAAAENERERAAFHEFAAARGLASGTAGQAQLAFGTSLLRNLAELDRRYAADESAIDRALLGLKAEYDSAVAQAAAKADIEELEALYKAWLERAAAAREEKERAAKADDAAYRRALEAADYTGDYAQLARFGWTKEQIQKAEERWNKKYGL